ncbi:MAG: hypothetical protein ABJD11_01490 [Gemmatimonadota bacterium]
MIRSHRRVHAIVFLGLSAMLPVILLAALRARAPIAEMSEIPRPLLGTGALSLTPPDGAAIARFGRLPLRVSMEASLGTPGGLALRLEPAGRIDQPDLLLYWDPVVPAGSDLPSDAVLVGSISPEHSSIALLSASTRLDRGVLLVYSLAHHLVVDTLSVVSVGRPGVPVRP